MKVHGFEVTPEIERTCLAAMGEGAFRAMDIALAAIEAVMHESKEHFRRADFDGMSSVPDRIADRLIPMFVLVRAQLRSAIDLPEGGDGEMEFPS